VIAIAERGQFIVLGPLVAGLAPPHLLGRYTSLYQLSFMAGVALGPAVGGALPGTSAVAIWWSGAIALALTGAVFLRLGDRVPDPLVPTTSPPLRPASEAT
jgi:MFS family permease